MFNPQIAAFAPTSYGPASWMPGAVPAAAPGYADGGWGLGGLTSPYAAMPTTFAPQTYMQPAAAGADMLSSIADIAAALVPDAAPVHASLGMQPQVMASPAAVAAAYGQHASPLSSAVRRVSEPAAAAVRGARRKGHELWAGVRDPRKVHVSQVQSRFNPSPTPGNRDCGPASVVMSLRMLGMRIPGMMANATPQRQIDRIRQLAQVTASHLPTTNLDLGRALQRAGAKVAEIGDLGSLHRAVVEGSPVILNGNPRHRGSYGWKYSDSQMTPYDGAHWIAVTGFDRRTGEYIVNDPLSKIGPVKVSRAALEAYRGGSIGLVVSN